MKTQKAIVTGGAGFIGSHLVDALVKRGIEVLVLDDLSSGSLENLEQAKAEAGTRFQFKEIELCSDELSDVVGAFAPDTIFHLAAQMNVRRSVEDPAEDARTNIEGTVRLLEAARLAGTHRVLFSSTGGAIYGEQESFPATEEHPTSPKSPYGLSKRAGELYLDYYGRDHGMRTVALRLGNVYGPRQNPKGEAGVVAIFATRLLNKETLRINGDGRQTRDFVYVSDVAEAFLKFLDSDHGTGFTAYNIGCGGEISVLDIVDALREAAKELKILPQDTIPDILPGGENDLSTEFGPALAGEQLRSVISPEKIKSELNWSAKVNLRQGLERTLRSFLEQGVRAK